MPLTTRMCYVILCDGDDCRRIVPPNLTEADAVLEAEQTHWIRDGPRWYCRRCYLVRLYGRTDDARSPSPRRS